MKFSSIRNVNINQADFFALKQMQPVPSSLEEAAQTSHPASNFTFFGIMCPLQKEKKPNR